MSQKHLGELIEPELAERLRLDVGSEQTARQAETVAVVVAKWKHLFMEHRARRVVLFVDGDAARCGLMRGDSPSRASAWFLTENWTCDIKQGCTTWGHRATRASNLANKHGRLNFERMQDMCQGEIKGRSAARCDQGTPGEPGQLVREVLTGFGA